MGCGRAQGSRRRSSVAQGRLQGPLNGRASSAFSDINLHWHDLRHEDASRLVERGVPLAQVRDLLGHASILTTERYDNQRLEALQAAVERLEGGKTFDPQTEPRTNFQESFKIPPNRASLEAKTPPRNPLQVTESLRDGERGWLAIRSSGRAQKQPTFAR